MSDSRLRELERRWQRSNLLSDEVAYLTMKNRAGYLTTSKLKVARYCGHPAASLVRPEMYEWDMDDIGSREWVTDIASFESQAIPRICIALAADALWLFEGWSNNDARPRNTIEVARDLIMQPDEELLLVVQAASVVIPPEYGNDFAYNIDRLIRTAASVSATWCTSAQRSGSLPRVSLSDAQAIIAIWSSAMDHSSALDDANQVLSQIICDALIPWALEYREPLLDKIVEPREQFA